MTTFEETKSKLIEVPIANCSEPFEKMCDASDFTVMVVLGQRRENIFRPIYYAGKTLNEAQENYTAIEKEILAGVFSCDMFKPY